MYELTGKEIIVKTTSKVDCGEIVTTKYFLDGGIDPVRVDQEVSVDPVFMMQAFARL
jgi:hypothetical protein